MMSLSKNEIKKLSFPDYEVQKMYLDIKNRAIKIYMSGGFLDINGGNKLGLCILKINNWESISASIYYAKTKEWKNLEINSIEKLSDICEFSVNEEIKLCGFGIQTGQWIEIIVSKPALHIECEIHRS